MGRNNQLKIIDIIAAILLLIGGLNWGLVGIFGFNLVEALLGSLSTASRVVYGLVGLAALYGIFMCRSIQRR